MINKLLWNQRPHLRAQKRVEYEEALWAYKQALKNYRDAQIRMGSYIGWAKKHSPHPDSDSQSMQNMTDPAEHEVWVA